MRMGWDRHTDRKSDIMRILIHVHMYHPLKVCTMGHGGGEGGILKKISNNSQNFSNLLSHTRENPIPQRESSNSSSLGLFPVALCDCS